MTSSPDAPTVGELAPFSLPAIERMTLPGRTAGRPHPIGLDPEGVRPPDARPRYRHRGT